MAYVINKCKTCELAKENGGRLYCHRGPPIFAGLDKENNGIWLRTPVDCQDSCEHHTKGYRKEVYNDYDW